MSTPRLEPASIAGIAFVLLTAGCTGRTVTPPAAADGPGLWRVYDDSLKGARYVDLTHTITPSIPVWAGFGRAKFERAINPETGQPYTYAADGFEATHYLLATDQLGTQLDPPAHWDPNYPAIDELPPTYAVRPLVVISIVDQVTHDPGYHLQLSDVLAWEAKHGRIPAGSVVMVRSDWSKDWPAPISANLYPPRCTKAVGGPEDGVAGLMPCGPARHAIRSNWSRQLSLLLSRDRSWRWYHFIRRPA